jgi:DNA-binding beta-propeller fold protein YncE
MKVARKVPVGTDPQEVMTSPDGKRAFVSCIGSNQVAEIDLATWKVARLIATGKGSDGLSWAAGE